jgi:hypothetical protein
MEQLVEELVLGERRDELASFPSSRSYNAADKQVGSCQ